MSGSAGTLTIVERTLLVQLDPELTDRAVRVLRDSVGTTLETQALRGLVLDQARVNLMDSYITRCIRDLAVSAKLMGVPTIVCGVQAGVADTLVEMGLSLGEVPTALNMDAALRLLRGMPRRDRGSKR
jgi:rsbT antagonist protein RsbS